jgi:hypothetical protein
LSPSSLNEIASVPSLRGRWVAIDPRGATERLTPLCVALKSGAVVVDADAELDVLCARLHAARQTSLTILFNGAR